MARLRVWDTYKKLPEDLHRDLLACYEVVLRVRERLKISYDLVRQNEALLLATKPAQNES